MKDRTYEIIWIIGGAFAFLVSFSLFIRTQNWNIFGLQGNHYSYVYSIYGILAGGIVLLIFNLFILFYALRSPSNNWYARIPLFLNIPPHSTEAKWLQRITFFFFVLCTLFFNGHFQLKFIHGDAFFYPNTTSSPEEFKVITGEEHFTTYYSVKESITSARRYWRYGFQESTITYLPFWTPVFLESFGTVNTLLSLFLMSCIFIPTEKHFIGKSIWNHYLKRKYAKQFKIKGGIEKKFDVFISHASEDKNEFVIPLFNALMREKICVWMDDKSIITGTPLTESINIGLLASRIGLIVLSESFFKKTWTRVELDFLFELQKKKKGKIVPIWYLVDAQYVSAKDERLGDIKSLIIKNKDFDFAPLISEIKETLNEKKP